jgi:uncharacterized protein YyaL (SSP411 family)
VYREDGVRLKVLRDKYLAGDMARIPLTVKLTPVEPMQLPTFSPEDAEAAHTSVTTLMGVMRKYYPEREEILRAQEAWLNALSEASATTDDTIYRGL